MFVSGRTADGWVVNLESQLHPAMNSPSSNYALKSNSITLREQNVYDKDGSGITPKIEKTLEYLKLLNVEIPQPDKIRAYLTYHSDMVYLLSYTLEMARLKFRVPAQLTVDLYQDPEIDDEYLILYVRQDEYDESVMKRIKQIRREYGNMIADLSGWLLLTTDFCSPGNTNDI